MLEIRPNSTKFRHPIRKNKGLVEINNAAIAASSLDDRANSEAKKIVTNLLTSDSRENVPASLPKPTALISQFDELSVEQRLNLIEVDALLFGLGSSKENRQAQIKYLRTNPWTIDIMKTKLRLKLQQV